VQKLFVVTGGNGYIGSHFCRLVVEKGYLPLIIDDFSTSPIKPTHQFGEFYQGKISDPEIWNKIAKRGNIEAVFHFAARALVGESEDKNKHWDYLDTNVSQTIKMLEEISKNKIKNIIFSSSCATFGLTKESKISENHPQNPVNTYGFSKYLVEQILKDLARKKMLRSVVLRYFNASGASHDGLLGENHDPETHLIPNVIKSILNKNKTKNTLQVFGNNFPTSDGTCIRDYIHVEDLALAHWKAYEYLLENQNMYYDDFNLGSESGTSILELIAIMEKVVSEKIQYEIKPPREGDPPILVSDSRKARSLLKFIPSKSIENSLVDAYNYLKKGML